MENAVIVIPLSANLAIAEVDPPAKNAASASTGSPPPRSEAARAAKSDPVKQSQKTSPPVALEFFAGPENRLPVVAIESLLEQRPSPFNPLVIVGAAGTGKTHLARGLAECWAAHHGDRRSSVELSTRASPALYFTAYFTAADFARELKTAIDARATPAFQNRVRNASLLVVENLTQLQNRRVAQQELVHTLDAIIDQGGQVVLTSTLPPERIFGLSADLRGRLAAGLSVSLAAPAAGTRLALVERLAQLRSIPIAASAARALADGLDGPGFDCTVPELLGALMQLDFESHLRLDGGAEAAAHDEPPADGRPPIPPRAIDTRAVRRWLAERRLKLQPSFAAIAKLAAKYFGLRVAELQSQSRRRDIVQARGIAIYLGRQLTSKSLDQLGKHFGGRDHTTVLHSYRSIEARLRTDPATRRAVSDISRFLAH